ncbi:Stk1 family PASTA domain-containing Ser/Thr kinase [Arthrobacter sp. NPDC090010]|uniref:Stk1 family PASTA domain-containing Ser/Thr kinase n=1 Tax=Arthrobacter sp. NPDC090010 TaxID=3363942 RepID=UPI0038093C9E
MQNRSEDPLIGTVVDNRYRVLDRIADGGMSTVYKALHISLERPVALKVLHPQLASDEAFVERFTQEARSSARLSHPHVVSVLDHGRHGRLTYLVMEYIQGRTLRDVIRSEGALTPRVAVSYLAPALEGLAAAHEAGLIHRDVKPENILISQDGTVKISDFGLARQASSRTSTGELLGTAAYLSPELFQRQDADARSDVYSCGILLYELLTGSVPFSGEMPIQVAYQHVNDEVPLPSLSRPGLAQDFDELVRWATAKDPDERPIDAGAFLGELRHVAASLPAFALDLPAPARPAVQDDGAPTEALDAQGATRLLGAGSATEVLGADPRTTILSPFTPGNATTVLPAQDAAEVPLNKRQQRKQDKETERRRQKALATPTHQLRPGNPRRRGAIWAVLLVLLALLIAAGGWFFGMGPGAQVTLPDLKNQPAEQASDILAGYGVSATEQTVFDDKIGRGLVVATQPPAGSVIRKFEGVQLLVSKGPQLFAVPTLTGQSLEAARNALSAANLAPGAVAQGFSDSVPSGQIISQDPGTGAQLRRGAAVNLVVSKGPQPIPVPSVLGLGQDEASQKIQALGLEASVAPDPVFSKDVPAGKVAAQKPGSGTLIKGQTVTLTISKGPRMVQVPNVFGKSEKDAVQLLQDAGFTVKKDYTYGRAIFGLVAGQDKTGEQPEGSTVTITVA